jgi:hypothetical protein
MERYDDQTNDHFEAKVHLFEEVLGANQHRLLRVSPQA